MSDDSYKLPDEIVELQLEQYRAAFESGNRDALMHATLFCAKERVAVPDWVDWELHQAWHRFIRREAKDLGEAFGIEWPKGQHKAKYLKRRRLQFAVYEKVNALHFKQEWHWADGGWRQATNPDWPLDETLFAAVGKELGIGKTLAGKYYYSVKRLTDSPPAAVQSLLGTYRKPEDGDE